MDGLGATAPQHQEPQHQEPQHQELQHRAHQRPELPWWPALDGLRGLAVVAVLVFHHDPRWLPGGFLGVSLFFTLSGFLITSLLLAEHDRTGRIDLRRFWARRARRLVPAACTGLLLAVVAALVAWPAEDRGEVLRHAGAAALNVANWWAIDHQSVYGALFGPRSPVEHFWSLAIEEQFYVVFPLVAALALRWRRRGLAAVLVVLTVASLAAALLLDAPNREYLGTDVRAAELLAGGLLALGLRGRAFPVRLAWAALALTGALWALVELGTPALHEGGLAAVAIVSAALVGGAVREGSFARALSAPALVSLGRISYGVYVVHLPLYVLLDAERTGLDGAGLFAVRVSATLLAASASFALLERPVRYGPRLGRLQGIGAYATAVAVVVIVVSGVAVVDSRTSERRTLAALASLTPPPAPIAAASSPSAERAPGAGDDAGAASPASTVASAPASTLAPSPTAGPTTSLGAPTSSSAPAPTAAPATAAPRPAAPRPVASPATVEPLRLLIVGDSTAETNGKGFELWLSRSPGAQVRRVTHFGSVVLGGHAVKYREGWVEENPDDEVVERALAAAVEFKPDAVVVFIGNAQLGDWQLTPDDEWRWFGDAVYEQRYVVALDAALSRLDLLGVPILWPTVVLPAWEPWKQGFLAGSGPVTLNDPARTPRLNQRTAEVVAHHPNVRMVPFAERVAPDGKVPASQRPDGLHFRPEAIAQILDQWLGDQLASDYRAVTTTPGARLHPPRRTAWHAA